MAARWYNSNTTANPGEIAASFIVHPWDCNWQNPHITAWATNHADDIRRGESSTLWQALRKEHEKEVRNKIKKLSEQSKNTWNFINENYETMFGTPNQVRK